MNFQQLRIIREATRWSFNLTDVSDALHTSQSGVSKHIRDLEDELGIQIFERRGKRLLGLTDPGRELLPLVERILHDASNVKQLAEHFLDRHTGRLVVAVQQTLGRYRLGPVLAQFTREFPNVQLDVVYASTDTMEARLIEGEADIAFPGDAAPAPAEIRQLLLHRWRHVAVVPHGHALARRGGALTLADLEAHPLIICPIAFQRVGLAFRDAGLRPVVGLSAPNSDLVKQYAEQGLGVGIISPLAFDAARDSQLAALELGTQLPENRTFVAFRRDAYLRTFARRFIALCAPEATAGELKDALEPQD